MGRPQTTSTLQALLNRRPEGWSKIDSLKIAGQRAEPVAHNPKVAVINAEVASAWRVCCTDFASVSNLENQVEARCQPGSRIRVPGSARSAGSSPRRGQAELENTAFMRLKLFKQGRRVQSGGPRAALLIQPCSCLGVLQPLAISLFDLDALSSSRWSIGLWARWARSKSSSTIWA